MVASGSLQIEQIVASSVERIVCIVRCMRGSVRPGDAVSDNDGQQIGIGGGALSAYVGEMCFPGRRIDLLDPPHVAKIEILGRGCAMLHDGSRIFTNPVNGKDFGDP
jgi:hypothetical protein